MSDRSSPASLITALKAKGVQLGKMERGEQATAGGGRASASPKMTKSIADVFGLGAED